jgi:predicted DNA-binding transcriptional regulator AlpA
VARRGTGAQRGTVTTRERHVAARSTHSADGPTWLSLEDFCEELGVPRSTAYKWCAAGPASGKFPRCRRLPNGKLRIRRDWLEEWLDGLPIA